MTHSISCSIGKYLTDHFRHEELHVRLNGSTGVIDNSPIFRHFDSIFSRVVCSTFPTEICQ